ncbi:unnamed protein product [Paramecium octaurelia]|uniref:Uncharacterized protein n=1 Tax=Paramecium octaurelia TaxID=43137 RepID=A0A8S1WTF6_PAROT|nr:unnamed protein product [Paramecium octaurelia]
MKMEPSQHLFTQLNTIQIIIQNRKLRLQIEMFKLSQSKLKTNLDTKRQEDEKQENQQSYSQNQIGVDYSIKEQYLDILAIDKFHYNMNKKWFVQRLQTRFAQICIVKEEQITKGLELYIQHRHLSEKISDIYVKQAASYKNLMKEDLEQQEN